MDGYVAYTGTVRSVIAKQDVTGVDSEETCQKAKAFYDSRDMAMSETTPFEDKDAIATTTHAHVGLSRPWCSRASPRHHAREAPKNRCAGLAFV